MSSPSDGTDKGALCDGVAGIGRGSFGVLVAVDFDVKKLEMDCCFLGWEEGGWDGLLFEGAIGADSQW
jgi:hypothetical protein